MKRICTWGLVALAAMILVVGCSAEGPYIPLLPSNTTENSGALTQSTGPEQTSHYLWGYYMVSIDQKDLSAEIVPIRITGGHWNVLQFLEQGPCTTCFKLKGVTPNPDGTLNVNVSVKHPFSNKNLTGFDVRGIAMFNGSHVFPASGLIVSDRTLGEGEVVNADGFTTLFNPTTVGHGLEGYLKGKLATATTPIATLNGYKRFVTDDPANTRNAFFAGEEIVATYKVDMPDSPNPWVFGYAVDASWAPPIHKPVDDPMTDFDLSANCPEPWKIHASDTPIGDGLTDCGGQVSVAVDVYDWQGKDSTHLPTVECPELFDGEVTASWKADGVGLTTYEAVVENAKNAPAGTYTCLLSKEAKENNPSKPWLDTTAYQLHELEVVVETMEPPTAVAEASQLSAYVGEAISFDASGSHDNDCSGQSIVKYEWDWENTGAWVEGGAQVDHSWSTEGTHHVQLRVTDDESQTDTLDEPLEITINVVKVPPIAIAKADPLVQDVGQPVHFSDDGSYDPDGGSIVKYEWDWDNDGTYDEEAIEDDYSWATPGTYYVQFRVTDDEGQTDTLDEPLEITINVVKVPPVAKAKADPLVQEVFKQIHFSDDGSYDPDGGSIVKYEWDWDDDGTYDEEAIEDDYSWATPGTYYVQFRVTDDEGQTDTLDQPLEITINVVKVPPIAKAKANPLPQKAGKPIQFVDDGSYDPDGGSIVKYEWDWNNDGTYDYVGSGTYHTWATPGTYYVQFRVTDDEGQTDTLDTPLEVDILPQSGSLNWAKSAGGTGYDFGRAVTALSDDSTVVTGDFQGSATFGKDEPNPTVLASAGSYDIFIARYTADGSLVWAKSAGGIYNDVGTAVTALSDDSTVVTGWFEGTATFGPGEIHSTSLTSKGSSDIFVACYNPDGTLAWAKHAGGTVNSDNDQGLAITALSDDSTVVTGGFVGSATFGPNEYYETTLVSDGLFDIFVARYNHDGSLAWARRAGGTGNEEAQAVTTLSDNSTAMTGAFSGSATFGPGETYQTTLDSAGDYDVFVARYKSNGTVIWAKRAGGTDKDGGTAISALSGFSDKQTVLTGFFMGTAVFGKGEYNQTSLYSVGGGDIFIARYNPDGTLWEADSCGGAGDDYGQGITVLSDDSYVVTGDFNGSATFGLGQSNETHLNSAGMNDIFIAAFTPSQFLAWAKSAGGIGPDDGIGITTLSDDSTVATGDIGGLAVFGLGEPYETALTPAGAYDIFIARFYK